MLDCTNAKTSKGAKRGYLTGVMYLSPGTESGHNTCPWMARCKKPCLYTSGHGQFLKTRAARVAKTRRWFTHPEEFIADVVGSIGRKGRAAKKYRVRNNKMGWTGLIGQAYRTGLTPALRLNGTSDIAWERESDIFQRFAGLIKYDYTKSAQRMLAWLHGREGRGTLRSGGSGDFRDVKNYSLTFSVGGVLDKQRNAQDIYREILRGGGNIAGAWLLPEQIPDSVTCLYFLDASGKPFKTIDLGGEYEVIDGDVTDLRFADKRGVIVGLSAKGSGGGDTKKLDTGKQRMFMQNPAGCSAAQSVPMTMLKRGDAGVGSGRVFTIGPDHLEEDSRTNPSRNRTTAKNYKRRAATKRLLGAVRGLPHDAYAHVRKCPSGWDWEVFAGSRKIASSSRPENTKEDAFTEAAVHVAEINRVGYGRSNPRQRGKRGGKDTYSVAYDKGFADAVAGRKPGNHGAKVASFGGGMVAAAGYRDGYADGKAKRKNPTVRSWASKRPSDHNVGMNSGLARRISKLLGKPWTAWARIKAGTIETKIITSKKGTIAERNRTARDFEEWAEKSLKRFV